MEAPGYIPEHRFRARFHSELTRRPGRLLAALVVTVMAPALFVAASVGRDGPGPARPTPPAHRVGVPLAPVAEDPWVANARAAAATCPGLPAAVLLAIGKVETGHGQLLGPSTAGAAGPMQFLPTTWLVYGTDGDGDGLADIMNSADAIHAAASLLCANGGADPGRLRSALWNYNHSADYVDHVLRVAGLSYFDLKN